MSDVTEVIEALHFAAHKHRFQPRKDEAKTPYINHVIAVVHTLATVGEITEPVTLIAAALHDTVEDTKTSWQELEDRFGPEVRRVMREEGIIAESGRDEIRVRAERFRVSPGRHHGIQPVHQTAKAAGPAVVARPVACAGGRQRSAERGCPGFQSQHRMSCEERFWATGRPTVWTPSLWLGGGRAPAGKARTPASHPLTNTHESAIITHGGRVRTNIDIDDDLMRTAMQASGERTKRGVVERALRLLVQTHRQAGVRRLRGRVAWRGDLNQSRLERRDVGR